MKKYDTLSEFYRAFEYPQTNITIDDVDRLQERLRAEGCSVRELKDGSVIVRHPAELEASALKRRNIQQREAAKYTKLGAAVLKQTAGEFAEACRILGVSQAQALMPAILETINLARQKKTPPGGRV